MSYPPKISAGQYDRRVVAAAKALPPRPTQADLEALETEEIQAHIDHRLGAAMPQDKRVVLVEAMRRIRARAAAYGLVHKAASGVLFAFPKAFHAVDAHALNLLLAPLLEVITAAEVQELLDLPVFPLPPRAG